MKTTTLTLLLCFYFSAVLFCNGQENNTINQDTTEKTLSPDSSKNKKALKKLYYKTGETKEIRETIGGKLHGKWQLFYKNGNLKKEGSFIDNKETGIWKIYDENKHLVFIESYLKGIEQGVWKSFYSNGMVKIEGAFENGQRQGPWKIYTNYGRLEEIVTFDNDIETGKIAINTDVMEIDIFSKNQSISIN